MFSFLNWIEIYIGYDMDTFFCIQNLLRQHGVKFKTKYESNKDRLNKNIISGADRSISVLQGVATKDSYRILVQKKDEHTAQALLYNADHEK